jgi:protocatechuate 3,4-dioxygenase beta subunit
MKVSKVLGRLGITGVAFATVAGFAPALLASGVADAATAGAISSIQVIPSSATSNVNYPVVYTVNVLDSNGNAATDTTTPINILAQPQPGQAIVLNLVGGGTPTNLTPNPGAAGAPVQVSVTPHGSQIIFYIEALSASSTNTPPGSGNVALTVYSDANGTHLPAGQTQGTATAVIQNVAVPSGEEPNQELAQSLTATPPGPFNGTTGQQLTDTVTVTAAAGSVTEIVPVYYVITDSQGNRVGGVQFCGYSNFYSGSPSPSNLPGETTCNLTVPTPTPSTTPPSTGPYTVTYFVPQSKGAGASGPAPGEPQTSVTINQFTPPTTDTVALVCNGTQKTAANACVDNTTVTQQTFTATVSTAGGAAASGVVVAFSVVKTNSGGAPASSGSVAPTQCITDSSGHCTATLTVSGPVNGDVYTVTAQIQGASNTGSSASATETYGAFNPQTRNIAFATPTDTATVGTTRIATVTVTNGFGSPVPGASVTFTTSGVGGFAGGVTQTTVTTGNNGQAQVVATSGTAGTQTITASLNPNNTQCSSAAGTNNQPPAGNCAATETINWTSGAPSGQGSISLSSQSTDITAGNQPILTATVLDANGNPVSGATVTLVAKGYGQSSYSTVGQMAATNTPGVYQLRVQPLVQTTYVAESTGSPNSNSVTEFVHLRVQPVPYTSRTISSASQLSGFVLPGRAVYIGLSYVKPGVGYTFLCTTASDAAGNWSFGNAVTPSSGCVLPRGTYTFVFYSSANNGDLYAAKSLRLTVS